MDVQTVRRHIIDKKPLNFYIFTGEEWQVQKIYIDKLAECKGCKPTYIDSITDIYSKLRNTSFISKFACYVVRDDSEIMQNEQLQAQIKGNLLKDNILILLITNLDKRLKFYKTFKDSIVEFEHLNDDLLMKYIKKEIDLSDKNCQMLIDICERDYGRILLEIDKIWSYYQKSSWTPLDDCFKHLIQDGTIYDPPYDAIFDFVDAVLKHKVNLAFDLLKQAYGAGENTMTLLTVLYTNIKQVLQVQSCQSKDISRSTGLDGWQIKNAKARSGYYTDDDLLYFLQVIRKCERGIKIGTIEEQYVMDYILINIL